MYINGWFRLWILISFLATFSCLIYYYFNTGERIPYEGTKEHKIDGIEEPVVFPENTLQSELLYYSRFESVDTVKDLAKERVLSSRQKVDRLNDKIKEHEKKLCILLIKVWIVTLLLTFFLALSIPWIVRGFEQT